MIKFIEDIRYDRMFLNRVLQNSDKLQVFNHGQIELGPEHDVRTYTGVIGFFVNDMFSKYGADLYWHCRDDGNIWTEWFVATDVNSHVTRKDCVIDGFSQWNLRSVPMSHTSIGYVNKLSHELWVMHKMTI